MAVFALGRDLGEALGVALRVAILDRDVATLDPAEFAQPLHKSGCPIGFGPKAATILRPCYLATLKYWVRACAPACPPPPRGFPRNFPHWFPEPSSCIRLYPWMAAKPWGTSPMPKQNNQAIKQARAANIPAARLLTWPERCLRPADRLDYAIRRWAIPVPPVVNRPVAARRGASQSAPHSDVSRSKVLLTEIQAAVGRCLRAEYDTALPIPARLANLLRQLEQQNGQAEQVA
jgi:hypothetical protein